MKPFLRSALLASACLLMPAMPALAAERAAASANNSASNSGNAPADDTASADSREEILVTGTLNQPVSSTTGLELTPRETPQSVTVIDRQRIDDPAIEAHQESEERAEDDAERGRERRHDQDVAGADHQPREDVASEPVGPEEVLEARRQLAVREVVEREIGRAHV